LLTELQYFLEGVAIVYRIAAHATQCGIKRRGSFSSNLLVVNILLISSLNAVNESQHMDLTVRASKDLPIVLPVWYRPSRTNILGTPCGRVGGVHYNPTVGP
jgi:hypothetical protein